MSFINFSLREVHCKIVYYGPGLGGKTTNIQYIYNKTNPSTRGKLISLSTETERTLFFDFFPLSLSDVRGLKLKFQLYTVPGQLFYGESRKLILRNVDGVVFVADSQPERMDANLESLSDLQANLTEHGYDFEKVPLVIQYNKRDLPNVTDLTQMRHVLNLRSVPDFEAIAPTGKGVLETLKAVAKKVVASVKNGG